MPRRRTLVLLTCGALMTCSEGCGVVVQVGVGGANTLFRSHPEPTRAKISSTAATATNTPVPRWPGLALVPPSDKNHTYACSVAKSKALN